MRMKILVLGALMLCGRIQGGEVGLPTECIALPPVEGTYLVCVWDYENEQWFQAHEIYDHAGSYSFHLPARDQWYWIGLWDPEVNKYILEKWIGHFNEGPPKSPTQQFHAKRYRPDTPDG